MNHYKQDHPLYNVQGHANLSVKDADNVMFNQFTAYILSEFPKMQNMKSFAVHEQTDIDEHALYQSVREWTSLLTSWVFFSYALRVAVISQINVYSNSVYIIYLGISTT